MLTKTKTNPPPPPSPVPLRAICGKLGLPANFPPKNWGIPYLKIKKVRHPKESGIPEQLYDPTVLWQIASVGQLCIPSLHSSISAKRHREDTPCGRKGWRVTSLTMKDSGQTGTGKMLQMAIRDRSSSDAVEVWESSLREPPVAILVYALVDCVQKLLTCHDSRIDSRGTTSGVREGWPLLFSCFKGEERAMLLLVQIKQIKQMIHCDASS